MSSFLTLLSRLFASLFQAFGKPPAPVSSTPTSQEAGITRSPQPAPNVDQALSPHFQLSELLVTNSGARAGLDNTPSTAVIANLKRLAGTLENVRSYLFSTPIIISSGYRSPAVNALIGGAANSAHTQGLAVDFTAPGYGRPSAIAKALAGSGLLFDQLIYEGTWVHLGLAPQGQAPRMQVLTAVFQAGRATTYVKGIIE